jgi:curli biogenesis system outer membrane secretion channel CsgG
VKVCLWHHSPPNIFFMKKLASIAAAIAVILLIVPCAYSQTRSKTKTAAKTTSASVATPPAEEELKPVTPEKGKEVVAIYPFTTSGRTYYDYALNAGTAVEAGFVRSKRFTVVERSRFGIIKQEDLFQEANTQEIVKKASRLGAKILVTGHVISATNGAESQSNLIGGATRNYIAQMSLSFKIIDVVTGEIMKSETILGKGKGNTPSEAMQSSYEDIDRIARIYVAEYLPQRFQYAADVEVDGKNRLKKFKIWGGSDQGLKENDLVEIFRLSYSTSPSGKRVEEKKLLGTAKIIEINSTESCTCELQKSGDIGESLLNEIKTKPESIVFEYKGTAKKKGLFNL